MMRKPAFLARIAFATTSFTPFHPPAGFTHTRRRIVFMP